MEISEEKKNYLSERNKKLTYVHGCSLKCIKRAVFVNINNMDLCI